MFLGTSCQNNSSKGQKNQVMEEFAGIWIMENKEENSSDSEKTGQAF